MNVKTYKYQAAMQGENLRKGTWLQEEDEQLISFVTRLGERRWDSLAKVAGMYVCMNLFNYDDIIERKTTQDFKLRLQPLL